MLIRYVTLHQDASCKFRVKRPRDNLRGVCFSEFEMRSMQLVAPRKFLEVEENVPELNGVGNILVRLDSAIVCGSDIPYFNGTKPVMNLPLGPGRPIHECAGVVVDSSSGRFKSGDRVVAMPDGDHGLREYYIAVEDDAIKLPDSVENLKSANLIQPLSTILFALDKLNDVSGASVTIIGAGPIGLLSAQLLMKRGAGPIRMIDPVKERCSFAIKMGVSDVLPLRSGQVATLVRSGELKHPESDICVEAVGHCTDTINDAIDFVKPGGVLLALGVPDQPVYPFEFNKMFRKNLHLITSVTPDWQLYLHKAAELFAEDQETFSRFITHRYGIHQAEAAFTQAEMKNGGAVKVLIDTSGWTGY